MKTISQYREEIAALMQKIGDMDAKCIAENRDPTEEELNLKAIMMDKIDATRKVVEAQERQEKMAKELTAPAAALTVPDGARIIASPDRAGKDTFLSFGEQLVAVMQAGMPGGLVDPRLRNIRAATGLGETVPSEGGFLVQTDFATDLLQDVFETGILASRCRRIPISGKSNSIKINGIDETSRATSRYGGIIAYWIKEAGSKGTGTKPKFRQIELNLHKLIGLCYATDELLDDAAALEGVIRDGFKGEFGFRIDDAIINGTGAGEPKGILQAGSLVSVAKEAGQAADTIMTENIVKMYSRLFASSRNSAVWLINQNVEPQLFTLHLDVGTGGIPVYMPAGGLSGLPYGTLFGRPVLPIEQCQTLGDQGDIILADFANGYVLADKGGIKTDRSIHVKFDYDETVFRFVLRVDGQPVRASALTPYKGTVASSQSHFVALDDRA